MDGRGNVQVDFSGRREIDKTGVRACVPDEENPVKKSGRPYKAQEEDAGGKGDTGTGKKAGNTGGLLGGEGEVGIWFAERMEM